MQNSNNLRSKTSKKNFPTFQDLVLRDEISRLPLKVVVLLLLLHSLLGGLIFHFWIQHMEFFPAVYFRSYSVEKSKMRNFPNKIGQNAEKYLTKKFLQGDSNPCPSTYQTIPLPTRLPIAPAEKNIIFSDFSILF